MFLTVTTWVLISNAAILLSITI